MAKREKGRWLLLFVWSKGVEFSLLGKKKEHCFGPFYVEFIFEKKLFVEAIPLLVIGIICYFC